MKYLQTLASLGALLLPITATGETPRPKPPLHALEEVGARPQLAAEKWKGNDQIYPPAAAAASAINMDGRGFFIHGRRTYIASGSIHYPRVPRELWRDRLLRIKRAGFNTVETYAFWNFHEPRENEWNFKGDHDVGAFLSLAKELGLYAIVRVGPYVCAEWDSGGWPIWLHFKPPFNVRTADPGFLQVNDHWYEKILPIVAAHQIHRGGNVILVQLENENRSGRGTVSGDPYFDHLREKALSLGIEVPFFFSALNHGRGPTPGTLGPRETPWLTTEFWCGWFDLYGPLGSAQFNQVDSVGWAILAQGGGGVNYYMLHGGSNFETGPLGTQAPKGLFGMVTVEIGDTRVPVKGWKMRGGAGSLDGDWQPLKETEGRPAFYRATFDCKRLEGRILRATSQGLTRGTMWLNGHNLGRYPEKIKINGNYLPECWLNDGANTLVIFDEEGAAPSAVSLEVETAASREVIHVSKPCSPSVPLVIPSSTKL